MKKFIALAISLMLITIFGAVVSCGGDKNGEEDKTNGDKDAAKDDDDDDNDSSKTDDDDDNNDDEPPPSISRLKASDTEIVDEKGKLVKLKGLNLGGWLFNETWINSIDYPIEGRLLIVAATLGIEKEAEEIMIELGHYNKHGTCFGSNEKWLTAFYLKMEMEVGVDKTEELKSEMEKYPDICDDSDLGLLLLLEERFGVEKRDELLDAFHRAWFTEKDVKWLADEGFNLVRVPIGYRTLIANSEKEPLTELIWNEKAFERVEDLLDWCEKYKVYAVIDIQEAPGGANDYSGPATLYEDEKMQELTVELWREISKRFKNRNIVAMYSLLAEPFSAPSNEARDEMYDRLVKAIREQGDDHLLVIHDGFKGMQTLPEPKQYGWEGVVYSTHHFEGTAESAKGYENLIKLYSATYVSAQRRQNVPYFIGSFSIFRDEDWAYEGAGLLLDWYDSSGYPWSMWTYKRIDDLVNKKLWNTKTGWGLRSWYDVEFDRPDIHLDDYDTLMEKFKSYESLELAPNEKLLNELKKSLAR